jgi:hypothetical protein
MGPEGDLWLRVCRMVGASWRMIRAGMKTMEPRSDSTLYPTHFQNMTELIERKQCQCRFSFTSPACRRGSPNEESPPQMTPTTSLFPQR